LVIATEYFNSESYLIQALGDTYSSRKKPLQHTVTWYPGQSHRYKTCTFKAQPCPTPESRRTSLQRPV